MNLDLNNLILALLALIPCGVGIRIILCLIQLNMDPDQEQLYKSRAKNALIFLIVAECTMSLLFIVRSYLS